MYMFEDMINMGLKEGQEFPSEDHKVVAIKVAICNPKVTQRDILMDVVDAVCKVPQEKIQEVTYRQLIEEYNCPHVA